MKRIQRDDNKISGKESRLTRSVLDGKRSKERIDLQAKSKSESKSASDGMELKYQEMV